MKNRLLTAFTILIALSVYVYPSVTTFREVTFANLGYENSNNLTDEELEIYDLINRERTRRKLSLLVWDERLASVARRYSRDMARGGFFDHADPNGKMVQDRIYDAQLFKWKKVGENLFWVENRDTFADLAVDRWMASPTHRQNVLDRSWTTTGIGVWRASNGRYYVTQVFLED